MPGVQGTLCHWLIIGTVEQRPPASHVARNIHSLQKKSLEKPVYKWAAVTLQKQQQTLETRKSDFHGFCITMFKMSSFQQKITGLSQTHWQR